MSIAVESSCSYFSSLVRLEHTAIFQEAHQLLHHILLMGTSVGIRKDMRITLIFTSQTLKMFISRACSTKQFVFLNVQKGINNIGLYRLLQST